jgi:hypothetical protein
MSNFAYRDIFHVERYAQPKRYLSLHLNLTNCIPLAGQVDIFLFVYTHRLVYYGNVRRRNAGDP